MCVFGTRDVMVIGEGNWHGYSNSNPGCCYFFFAYIQDLLTNWAHWSPIV